MVDKATLQFDNLVLNMLLVLVDEDKPMFPLDFFNKLKTFELSFDENNKEHLMTFLGCLDALETQKLIRIDWNQQPMIVTRLNEKKRRDPGIHTVEITPQGRLAVEQLQTLPIDSSLSDFDVTILKAVPREEPFSSEQFFEAFKKLESNPKARQIGSDVRYWQEFTKRVILLARMDFIKVMFSGRENLPKIEHIMLTPHGIDTLELLEKEESK